MRSVLWHRSTRPHCTTGNKELLDILRIPTNWDESNHIDCRHGSDSLTTPSNNQISLILARLHLPLPTTSPSASQRLWFVGMWDVPKGRVRKLDNVWMTHIIVWFLIFPKSRTILVVDTRRTSKHLGRPLERGFNPGIVSRVQVCKSSWKLKLAKQICHVLQGEPSMLLT